MNMILYEKRMEQTVTADVTEEVSLPDYLPEIRRVTGVQASASVDGKYLSGTELEADGCVTYTLFYTAGDGTLAELSQTTSYTAHIPVRTEDDRFSAADIVLAAAADAVSCRVTGPRRITLSSKVRLNAWSQKPADASLHTAEGAEDWRCRREELYTGRMYELRESGEAEGELRVREGMQLLYARGALCVNDVRTEEQQIRVKGDALLSALFRNPDGGFERAEGRVPVDDVLALPDFFRAAQRTEADEKLYPAVFARVVLLEMEGEENGVFRWKMAYDLDGDVLTGCRTEVAADAYLPGREDILQTEEFHVTVPAGAVNGRLTAQGSVQMRPDAVFVCAWGTAIAEKAEQAGGRLLLHGTIRLEAITEAGGEYALDEVTIPLRYACDALPAGTAEGEGFCGRMQADVTEIMARTDGRTLQLTAELSLAVLLLREKTMRAAVSLQPAEEDGENETIPVKNCIRIYRPDAGETDWDVEKRFRLGREAVRTGDVYIL